jgi:prevent-host-death family protein
MMVKRMSSREARANFADLLGLVYYGNQPVIVERKGKPVAVVISPEQYAQLQKEQERAWATVDRVRQRNADKDPDEVLADVTAVVEDVRQKLYEEEKQAPKSRR